MFPYPVKENSISATFDNDVLQVRLPKAEEVKAKKIEIKAHLPEGDHVLSLRHHAGYHGQDPAQCRLNSCACLSCAGTSRGLLVAT